MAVEQVPSFADDVFASFLVQNSNTIQESTKTVHMICRIQAFVRGFLVHRRYHIVMESTIIIQKNYKRKRAVVETSRLLDAIVYLRRKNLFDKYATTIQAAFRGFYIRKYVLNITQRRKYVAAVATISANVAEEAREFTNQCILEQEAEENRRKAEYIKSLAHKHHLRSTKSIPGVYKPCFPTQSQSINGRPIDEILKTEGLAEAKRATFAVTRSRNFKFPLINTSGSLTQKQSMVSSSTKTASGSLPAAVPAPLSAITSSDK